MKLSSKYHGASEELEETRNDLNRTAQEGDDLSSKLSQMLERRDRLDEMKGLVEAMRHASIGATPQRDSVHHTDEDLENGDEDDFLMDHLVHRSYPS